MMARFSSVCHAVFCLLVCLFAFLLVVGCWLEQTREEAREDKLLACEQLLDAVPLGGAAEAGRAVVPNDRKPALSRKVCDVSLPAESVAHQALLSEVE